jgi:hypothetical protein
LGFTGEPGKAHQQIFPAGSIRFFHIDLPPQRINQFDYIGLVQLVQREWDINETGEAALPEHTNFLQ